MHVALAPCLRYTHHCPDRAARLGRIALAGGVLAGLAAFAPVRAGMVDGDSMTPTLHSRQPFFYRPCSGSREALRRGEIVLFQAQGEVYIKRIFALPGETLWLANAPAGEDRMPMLLPPGTDIAPWKERFSRFTFTPLRIAEGHVYVLGDNLCSIDSRQLGPIPLSRITGRVLRPRAEERNTALNPAVWDLLPALPPTRTHHAALRPARPAAGLARVHRDQGA